MSTYNTTLKEKSPMKTTINNFLGRFSNPETKAIVIDAESLLSSSTLKECGVNPLNIVVINTDESIIKKHTRRVIPFLLQGYHLRYYLNCMVPMILYI